MSKTISTGYTDTVATPKTLSRVDLSYAADFRVRQDEPGEAILVNLTSPIDRTETIRYGYSEIKDVYKNTSIDASVMAPSKKGVQILAQVNDTFSLTDSADPTYRVDLPVSAHIIVKIPACEYITPAMVETLVARAAASLYDTGATTTTKISQLLKGSLVPTGL